MDKALSERQLPAAVKLLERYRYNEIMKTKNYTPIDDLIAQSRGVSKVKEGEPIIGAEFKIQESTEHEPNKEVERFINPRAETIKLPKDLKEAGLEEVNSTNFPNYKNIKLPIADDKVVTGLHAPITSSLRWLATFAVYLLQIAHLKLKVVHGKVVRVIRP